MKRRRERTSRRSSTPSRRGCQGNPDIEESPSLFILARRASVLMLGFAVLLLAALIAPPSPTRRAVSLAAGVTMAGFALTGSFELLRGTLEQSVWGAVGVEAAFAIAFLTLWATERRVAGAPELPTR